MPSTRYTVRLPLALDQAVQAHLLATSTPFAVLMREALAVTACNRNGLGLQSARFSAHITCLYPSPPAHISCL